MIIETINVSGTTQVAFVNHINYIWIKNKSSASMYASHDSTVTAGASGTTEIPAKEAGMLIMPDNNTIYISGSGSAEIKASDFAECPFKSSGRGGDTFVRVLGVTTTPLTDGATTSPIIIDGAEHVAEPGDLVAYGSKEFLFNTNGVWDESGDVTNVYTKSETDTLLSAKANTADVVLKSDIEIKTAPTTAEITAAITDIWGA